MSTIQIYDGEKFVPFNISNAIEMPVGFEDFGYPTMIILLN